MQTHHNWGLAYGNLTWVSASRSGEVLQAGDLELHPTEFLAYANGHVLTLTQKEQQLLAALIRNQGRVLSRGELYWLVWGRKLRPGDRTVDVYVRKLRVRLSEALPEWTFIHTHYGLGYRFTVEKTGGGKRSLTTG